MQQMMDRVREDFQEKQYYVTGNFSSELFTDECVASKAEHAEPTLMLLCNGIYSRARVWWWSQTVDTFLLYVQLPLRRPNSPSKRCVFGWLTMSHWGLVSPITHGIRCVP